MKIKIYSIRDHKTGNFGPLQVQSTDGAMIREFSDAVNFDDPKNAFKNHSEDFELFTIGELDTETGAITPVTPAKSVITATELKK